MKPTLRRALLLATLPLCLIAAGACSGSSSETPWPAEPESPALGPRGEFAPDEADPMQSPDAGPAPGDDER